MFFTIQYNVNGFDNTTALIMCLHDNTTMLLLECTNTGQWSEDALDYCPSPATTRLGRWVEQVGVDDEYRD